MDHKLYGGKNIVLKKRVRVDFKEGEDDLKINIIEDQSAGKASVKIGKFLKGIFSKK